MGTALSIAVRAHASCQIGVNYSAALDLVAYRGQVRRFVGLFAVDRETQPDPLDEAATYMCRLGDLGMNVVRIWLEPHDMFPYGNRLNPVGEARFERFLAICAGYGIKVSVGTHLSSLQTGWRLHNFQPPHHDILLEHLHLLGRRWGGDARVFSWTIVGKGQLPWYTRWLAECWPHWLQYWYNDDLAVLHEAWGSLPGVQCNSFDDAPIPPRNVGACLGIETA